MKNHFFVILFFVFLSQIVLADMGLPKRLPGNRVLAQVGVGASGASSDLSDSGKTKNSLNSKNVETKKSTFPEPPKFKSDEYAIFLEDAYKIFKTKNFEKLELTETCFKNGKPSCQAYEFAQIKPKKLKIKYPGLDNMSAIHCEEVGGRNLLALDNKNNHHNFCRFGDGSMVNSWSMYYKQFPQSTFK